MGGIVGLLMNALFADSSLVALDGVTSIPGGWINHNWKQLYIQFAYVCATVAYTFVVTALLAKMFDLVPSFRLRASAEEEASGMDDTQVCLCLHQGLLHETLTCAARLASSSPTTLKCGATIWTGRQCIAAVLSRRTCRKVLQRQQIQPRNRRKTRSLMAPFRSRTIDYQPSLRKWR